MIDRLSSISGRGAALPGQHASLCRTSIRPIGPACMQVHSSAIQGAKCQIIAPMHSNDKLCLPSARGGHAFRLTPRAHPSPVLGSVGEGIEGPIQVVYLSILLSFLVVGAYLVVRQVLARRELEEAAKVFGDRVRSGEGSGEDYLELGVILLRKKLYTQSIKNLEKAKKAWKGPQEELAKVYNAQGFAHFNLEQWSKAAAAYKQAVELQPQYVTAWNNLGDAYEKAKEWRQALDAYNQALVAEPGNSVAQGRAQYCRGKVERMQLGQ
ncbi:PYG7 [Auxenochlorella protothecoides x Auxenochlorella symbiontica]